MEEFGVGIAIQHPLLSSPFAPVLFLRTENVHHLPLQVISKGPALFFQPRSIRYTIRLLDLGKEIGLENP
jgi:hypothetical protein